MSIISFPLSRWGFSGGISFITTTKFLVHKPSIYSPSQWNSLAKLPFFPSGQLEHYGVNQYMSSPKKKSKNRGTLTGLMVSIQSGTSQPDSFTTLAIGRMRGISFSVKKVTAFPFLPARPNTYTYNKK